MSKFDLLLVMCMIIIGITCYVSIVLNSKKYKNKELTGIDEAIIAIPIAIPATIVVTFLICRFDFLLKDKLWQ